MQAADLVKYINDPQSLDEQSIAGLQKLAADFPYFQPAHMLLSIASRKWDASVYQQSLKKTAIVVTNRAHLYNLVHAIETMDAVAAIKNPAVEIATIPEPETVKPETVQEPLKEEKVPETITPAVETKPVIAPEEQLEREIEKQVVAAFVEKEILKTPELHHPPVTEEPGNFVAWLALLKKNNGQPLRQSEPVEKNVREEKPEPKIKPETVIPVDQKKQKHRALIDKIIESSPGLIRTKEEQKFFVPDLKAKESLLENEHLVTETLANIYATQGNVNKAVRAYQILSLKFPQKSAYFADLIKKLKNNQ